MTLGFLVNNILNAAYTVRPGVLEAPRNISLRLDMNLKGAIKAYLYWVWQRLRLSVLFFFFLYVSINFKRLGC